MSLMGFIEDCNRCDIDSYIPWSVGHADVGFVHADLVSKLLDAGDAFVRCDRGLRLSDRFFDAEARTDAVSWTLGALVDSGDLPPRRDESYPVTTGWGGEEYLQVDRAHVPALGTLAFGLHVNGYVVGTAGMEMWIGRRARSRLVEPGKLDNMVGGGQPAGLSLAANLVKESEEEAGIPAAIASKARPVGVVAYALAQPLGLRRDLLFCYDLILPENFEPQNTDGEVQGFLRLSMDDVITRLREQPDSFKFNVPLVIIDFLIRHGLLDPDHEPEYAKLARSLRAPIPG